MMVQYCLSGKQHKNQWYDVQIDAASTAPPRPARAASSRRRWSRPPSSAAGRAQSSLWRSTVGWLISACFHCVRLHPLIQLVYSDWFRLIYALLTCVEQTELCESSVLHCCWLGLSSIVVLRWFLWSQRVAWLCIFKCPHSPTLHTYQRYLKVLNPLWVWTEYRNYTQMLVD